MERDEVTIEECLLLYEHSFAVVLRAGSVSCIKDERKKRGCVS